MIHATMKTSHLPSSIPDFHNRISYEQFLDMFDEDTRAEWVHGEVVYMSPASLIHQDLTGFLSAILRYYVEFCDLGMICPAPFQMKTGPHLPGREPDILFINTNHLDRLRENFLNGPADMVVEIISPESVRRDRQDKFLEYEKGGVREYWLIDPMRKQAEFFTLKDHRFQQISIDENHIFQSLVLTGLWLNVEWLWKKPLPALLTVLKEWKIV